MISQTSNHQVTGRDAHPKHDLVDRAVVVVRIQDRVLAIAPVVQIGVSAAATDDAVIARTTSKRVAVRSTITTKVARYLDQVVARSTLDRVVGVVAEGDRVVAISTAQHIAAPALVHDNVITRTTFDRVAANAVYDRVVTFTAIDAVTAVVVCDRIVAVAAIEYIISRTVSDRVVASPTIHHSVLGPSDNCIAPIPTKSGS